MTKINKFNSTIMYIGQNERRTMIGIESWNPSCKVRRLSHYTMSRTPTRLADNRFPIDYNRLIDQSTRIDGEN